MDSHFWLCIRCRPLSLESVSQYKLFNFDYVSYTIPSFLPRHHHASFFDALHAFDKLLSRSIHQHIAYIGCNHRFYIECISYAAYYIIVNAIKLAIIDQPSTLAQYIFITCCNIEIILFGCAIFHMKNCSSHLVRRYDMLNAALAAAYIDKQAFRYRSAIIERFYRVMELYGALDGVQKRVQSAFGVILLYICVNDMFTITFSVYYTLVVNFRVSATMDTWQRRHLIMADFIIYELPMVLRNVYLIVYFHRLGRRVSF